MTLSVTALTCGFHVLKGSGRAFCAGGDVVALYRLINEGMSLKLFFVDSNTTSYLGPLRIDSRYIERAYSNRRCKEGNVEDATREEKRTILETMDGEGERQNKLRVREEERYSSRKNSTFYLDWLLIIITFRKTGGVQGFLQELVYVHIHSRHLLEATCEYDFAFGNFSIKHNGERLMDEIRRSSLLYDIWRMLVIFYYVYSFLLLFLFGQLSSLLAITAATPPPSRYDDFHDTTANLPSPLLSHCLCHLLALLKPQSSLPLTLLLLVPLPWLSFLFSTPVKQQTCWRLDHPTILVPISIRWCIK